LEARTVTVHGKGLLGLQAPSTVLDAGNSGTTTRLISGILAGQAFPSVIDGDDSLRKRPMRRIIEPLSRMGAVVTSLNGNDCVPLRIEGLAGTREGASLDAITYRSPVASAQVKSCVLLAGLYADGPTCVLEPAPSRDHTERMLRGFGASVRSGSADGDTLRKADGDTLRKAEVDPRPKLTGQTILVISNYQLQPRVLPLPAPARRVLLNNCTKPVIQPGKRQVSLGGYQTLVLELDM
jgi:3-phosphoshikimate 1-carboxyvinyltransferase